jgi:hypothetical protein
MGLSDYYKNQITSWTNAHWVFIQTIQGLYDLHNHNPLDPTQALPDYLSQVGEIQGLIQSLINQKSRARALGAGWSFSKVGVPDNDGYILNSQFLKTWFPLNAQSVIAGINADNMFLFQCGMSIHDVHLALGQNGKSLPVSGSSCGQTLIGAFTTGTHGSAFNGRPGTGAVQDAVRGLHLIVSPTRQVWLEPQSRPVVNTAFLSKLGIGPKDYIQDDDLFYSALNGLGAFGVVHGTLLEAVDEFYLDIYRTNAGFDSLKNAITTFNFNGVDMGGAAPADLYHFEVMNNIFASDKTKGAVVTVMSKTPTITNKIDIALSPDGEELPTLWAKITGLAPALVPLAINTFITGSYPPILHKQGTLADQNPFITNVGPGSVVCSMGIDMKDSYDAMMICQKLNTGNMPAWYEFRFIPQVSGSKKVLGFQRFAQTCIFEIAGFGSAEIVKYINDCLVMMEASGIKFTFHWGKYQPIDIATTKYGYPQAALQYQLTPAKLVAMYQDGSRDNVAVWKASRNKLFGGDQAMMKFFENDMMDKLGLSV